VERLAPNEVWLDVIVLFAGLRVEGQIELAPDVRIEQILEANLVAQAALTAADVILQRQSDADAPAHPVNGMRYRVRGKRLVDGSEYRINHELIEAPKRAFRRAAALLQGSAAVGDGGTFVIATDQAGASRYYSRQFNFGNLSVHYDGPYFGPNNEDELRRVFAFLQDPYLSGEGTQIGVAIDRLGFAPTRANDVDVNLDLCVAAEIAFSFGPKKIKNEELSQTLRDNAAAFFGDGEFFWDRATVYQILRDSYKERSDTVHGRAGHGAERDKLGGLNAQLRELMARVLLAYVERRPTKRAAKTTWPDRRQAVKDGTPLPPIFIPPAP